jgi:hypothetical protein
MMPVTITSQYLVDDVQIWTASFKFDVAIKDRIKALGWRFSSDTKSWGTTNPTVAFTTAAEFGCLPGNTSYRQQPFCLTASQWKRLGFTPIDNTKVTRSADMRLKTGRQVRVNFYDFANVRPIAKRAPAAVADNAAAFVGG